MTTARTPATRHRPIVGPTVVAGAVTAAILLPTYLATAAPDLTFWDASELATAAQTLGIPHPPGTPLWVLAGRVSAIGFGGAGPARAVTMLSVVTTVLACALGAALAHRWIGGRGAVAAGVGAGTMSTVWANATETEVYAAALLLAVSMLAAGDLAGRAEAPPAPRDRWRALLAYLVGLAVPLHLSALVVLPAAIAIAWCGPRPTWRQAAGWGLLALLGVSCVAVLPIRSAQGPLLDSGHPVTLRALLDLLQRVQYDVPALWPRRAPAWLQLGNVAQWADWQVALGRHPAVTPGLARTPLTLLWLWLGAIGVRAVGRRDPRAGRALLVLLGSATVGVVLWLNLRAGPSYGFGVLPDGAPREARERDYFFALAFWTWGLCAGIGIATVAVTLSRRLAAPWGRVAAAATLALAAVPLLANLPVMDRQREPVATLPRTVARLLLDAVPPNGLLLLGGDNDVFPVWYLQLVEEVRPDVRPVAVPLLAARWYREQLARERVLPRELVEPWPGLPALLASLGVFAESTGRPLRVSVLLPAEERSLVAPALGWLLQGLVYAPGRDVPAGTVDLDLSALSVARSRVPRSALAPLGPSVDRTAEAMQDLLRCTTVTARSDPLLVSTCNGA